MIVYLFVYLFVYYTELFFQIVVPGQEKEVNHTEKGCGSRVECGFSRQRLLSTFSHLLRHAKERGGGYYILPPPPPPRSHTQKNIFCFYSFMETEVNEEHVFQKKMFERRFLPKNCLMSVAPGALAAFWVDEEGNLVVEKEYFEFY